MTLGTRKQAKIEIQRTERLSYNREMFPLSWNGHNAVLLKNYMYRTDEGKLLVELDVYCNKCRDNCAIRDTIDMPSNEHIRAIKVIPIGYFYTHNCKKN
jgi:hypothetical protein